MKREFFINLIEKHLKVHSACAILGPRQCGKTTLARMYADQMSFPVHFLDLENPYDLAKLESPMLYLEALEGLIIIDEIQRRPELFPVLRYLIDTKKQKYLILGSASRDLIRQSSETLAGRLGYIELPPFSSIEVNDLEKLWVRGGFPKSYLAEDIEDSWLWRESYIKTYIERDIPALEISLPSQQIFRFWMMITHFHGGIFNASEIGRSLGVSDHTARKYLDVLVGTFMVRLLPPWFENLSKRQVKSVKIYIRDSGLYHSLLNTKNLQDIRNHPKSGASWEGFVIEQIILLWNCGPQESYFWRTQKGAELDLLIFKNNKRLGFEVKYTDYPKITPSMRIALEDLKLDALFVIYPGKDVIPLDTNITAVPISQLKDLSQKKEEGSQKQY